MRKVGRFLWGLLPLLLPGWAVAGQAELYRRVDGSGAVLYSNVPSQPFLLAGVRQGEGPSGLRALIRSAAVRHGVDPRLVEAIISVESDFDPLAVSRKGAMGLMQLMPQTADRYAVQNPFDPLQNIIGGIRYLRDLLHRFQGDLRWALAAYNAGETAVETHQGIPPYRETRDYVARVLTRYGQPAVALQRDPSPFVVYRFSGPEGRSIYTNIPPRISLR